MRSKEALTQIIHIPARHENTNDQLERELGSENPKSPNAIAQKQQENEETAKEQFKIATFLRRLAPDREKYDVWVEGYAASGPSIDRKAIKKTFPKGLPSDFGRLNSKQKKVLVQWGAPAILSVLGELPPIKGAENEFLNARAINSVVAEAKRLNTDACSVIEQTVAGPSSDLKSLILDRRETTALYFIREGRKPGKLSFLVFGGDHDFTNDDEDVLVLDLN